MSEHGRHDGPDHDHRHHATRRLAWVLAITLVYTLAEVVGGIWANSLALLADAGHMMTDDVALALALAAAWFGRLPPDPARTYGYQRAEILAALANGVLLVAVCVFLFWEAWHRLLEPPQVRGGLMAVVATGGLVVNVAGVLLLHGAGKGLNVRAAYLHVMGDLLGSVGTIVAAVLVGALGWRWADPVASVLIGAIVVVSSFRLIRRSVHVLMEGVPAGVDLEDLRAVLLDTRGVAELHDLHVWSLSGGAPILTCHLVLDHSVPAAQVLRNATSILGERFGITHATLQIEPPDYNIVTGVGAAPPGRG